MSEPKFTPGPWGNVDFALSNEIGTLKNPLIAVVQSRHCDSPDELRANAHLIAAAPDLYKALKRIDAFIDDEYMDAAVFSDIIYNALAKARGESHE